MLVKARKIYKCEYCGGNIQKGEIHEHVKLRLPVYDENENQTGIEYVQYRHHKRECRPRLLYFGDPKMIMKNCNFGIHSPSCYTGPDDGPDDNYCKWCGALLDKDNNEVYISINK